MYPLRMLQELLAIALPHDRNLERRFKEWLAAAHRDLDRSTRYENMASSQDQVCGWPGLTNGSDEGWLRLGGGWHLVSVEQSAEGPWTLSGIASINLQLVWS